MLTVGKKADGVHHYSLKHATLDELEGQMCLSKVNAPLLAKVPNKRLL